MAALASARGFGAGAKRATPKAGKAKGQRTAPGERGSRAHRRRVNLLEEKIEAERRERAAKEGDDDGGLPPLPESGSYLTEEEHRVLREKREALGYVRPVDPEEAARGSVEHVTLQSWTHLDKIAKGDVGDLEVVSHKVVQAGGRAGEPLYPQLVRELERLEDNGGLTPSRRAHQRELPGFTQWRFGRRTYAQHLTDNLVVHAALEGALSGPEAPALLAPVVESGVARAGALAADLRALGYTDLTASRSASAHAQHIARMGTQGTREAHLQLVAHAFALYVSHLTSGTRIGAKAVEQCDLFRAHAIAFFQSYPEDTKDPLQAFVAALERVGVQLESDDEVDQIFAELGRAMQKAANLLYTLAVVEEDAGAAEGPVMEGAAGEADLAAK